MKAAKTEKFKFSGLGEPFSFLIFIKIYNFAEHGKSRKSLYEREKRILLKNLYKLLTGIEFIVEGTQKPARDSRKQSVCAKSKLFTSFWQENLLYPASRGVCAIIVAAEGICAVYTKFSRFFLVEISSEPSHKAENEDSETSQGCNP